MVVVDTEPDPKLRTAVWRDPLSAGWRAHRGLLLLRLRWHERRSLPTAQQRPINDRHGLLRQLRRDRGRP
jgi:hypothetical protein